MKSFDQKTTYKIRDKEYYRMIDYMFYEHSKLEINKNARLLTKEEIGDRGLPSLGYPSDHLSLCVNF